MEDKVGRRLFPQQCSGVLAADGGRMFFLAQIIVNGEWHFGMSRACDMTIMERVGLLVIAMGKPFGIGDDAGSAIGHRATLPFAPPAGKQRKCNKPFSRPPRTIARA